MKTFIAIPCMDQVAAGFAASLATLTKVGEVQIGMVCGSLVYDSRNKLAAQMLAADCDYMLSLDSDMIFDQNLLERMIVHMEAGKDIVTGLYFRRAAPYTPVIFKKLEINGDQPTFEGYEDYPKDGPFEVAACGGGALMVRKEVLLDMALNDHTWFDPVCRMGEDMAFCHRARQLGYKIWCDPAIKLGHVGQLIVTEAMYDSLKGGR